MQQSKSDGTYQGSYTPRSCDRCRFTACPSIHDYAAPMFSCHLEFCEVCTDFAELDQRISTLQDQLISLVHKRWAMKSSFNDHHDRLTRHLPMEIISNIFLFTVADSTDPLYDIWPTEYRVRPPLLLASICKKWRDITIGLPHLWATLYIKPWSPKFSFNLARDWLSRSSTVPLFVKYCGWGHNPWSSGPWDNGATVNRRVSLTRVMNLLRTQATRWEDIIFKGEWPEFRTLIDNIDDVLSINTLDITITNSHGGSVTMAPIRAQVPIGPIELTTTAVSIGKIPMHWNNLAYLNASSMHLDELVHIIQHANKLTSCIVNRLLGNDRNYPLPTESIIHHAITDLKLNGYDLVASTAYSGLVPYLTIPRLKIISYDCGCDYLALDALINFLERSRAPPHTFYFSVTWELNLIPWFERLSTITHVALIMNYFEDDSEYHITATETFLSALSRTSGPLLLPCLEELRMEVLYMSKAFFCDIFTVLDWREGIAPAIIARDVPNFDIAEDNSGQQTVGVHHTRPLKLVSIRYLGDSWHQLRSIAEEDMFSRMSNIRTSGAVLLEIIDYDGHDLIECAANIITIRELPFSCDEIGRLGDT